MAGGTVTLSASTCPWIEGDDFIERMHRGEAIYCPARPIRPGASFCAEHHARAYISSAAIRRQRREAERAAAAADTQPRAA
jgi:hypothetical protein